MVLASLPMVTNTTTGAKMQSNANYQRTTAASRRAAQRVRYIHYSHNCTYNVGANKMKRAARARAKAMTS